MNKNFINSLNLTAFILLAFISMNGAYGINTDCFRKCALEKAGCKEGCTTRGKDQVVCEKDCQTKMNRCVWDCP